MSIRHATFHQFRIFDAVARNMSFARAAEELHLTPPALSIQVKQLAEAAGVTLIEQIGKKIHLTHAGRIMAEACRDMDVRLERLTQDLSALQGLERGTIKLAILTTAEYFAPRMLGEFCAQHPGIDASMFVGNRETLLERMAQNLDDLYIFGQPPANLNIVAESFAYNPLVVVARSDHPLAGEKNIPSSRLNGVPFILREPGSGIRLATEDYLAKNKVRIETRMEVGSNEAIKQAVKGELGLAVLSLASVAAEIERGELTTLDVHGFPLMRRWHVAYPSGKNLSHAATEFRKMLFDSAIVNYGLTPTK
ncbi:MAG TPA: LysR family transcriptional regulator [Methylophilaceae bacterium]|jgi:DNA-binding transcriptional LysR family regulator|nr:LysR family transcriptional regulator [Methylophilaceae bacterium]